MPGSSRMPVSLRETYNSVKKARPADPLALVNLELYVPQQTSRSLPPFFLAEAPANPPAVPSTLLPAQSIQGINLDHLCLY